MVITFIEEGNLENLFEESKYASKIDKIIDMLYSQPPTTLKGSGL
jgi:hypothetical protein